MPTTILASRYNTLRNNVNLVLGTSNVVTADYGYGQAFSTNSVVGTRSVANPADADKISAQDYEDLYIDLIRTRFHQVGASVAIQEFVIGDYDTNTATADKIEEAYILGLESLATNIITDRLVVDPNNLTIESVPSASSTRTSNLGSWNGTISHIFTITFVDETERRHFFNAGGQIRFSASVDYTGSQGKTVDWQTILNAMGSTSFKATETVNNSSVGTGSNIGNYDLTSSYQLIYSRTGGAVYARNRYNIYAANSATTNGTSRIIFKVEFLDGAPNNTTFGIDEDVFGTFNSIIETATPSSQVTINGTTYPAVIIPGDPVGANIKLLSSATPLPTYTITPAASSVNEGSSLTFNVATTDVANATTLYWTVTNAGDFATSSGSFTITSNSGSFSVTPTADATTEGPETFTASVRTSSTSGDIVATSDPITINDTSIGVGSAAYTTPGSYTFTVPEGITSISVVCVGGGGGGGAGSVPNAAGGGALAYVNNIAVTAGEDLAVTVGAGGVGGTGGSGVVQNNGTAGGFSSLARSGTILCRANGGTTAGGTVHTGTGGSGGGASGLTSAGGGGAGGYSGAGGAGAIGAGGTNGGAGSGGAAGGGGQGTKNFVTGSFTVDLAGGGGGGVGILGEGASGAGGLYNAAGYGFGGGGGSGGATGGTGSTNTGRAYGGGGGVGNYVVNLDLAQNGFAGAGGAVRIIWPGNSRQFPSTLT